MQTEKRMSLKEIASLSGVSVATVSRIINKSGRYSLKTAEHVNRIIAENNFQPNTLAKALRENKLNTIGLIFPDMTNEFYAALGLSLQEELFSHGYSCMIFNTNESEQIEQACIDNLVAARVSGIVSVNGRIDVSEFFPEGTPAIYIDRDPADILRKNNAAFLSSDHEKGGWLAGKELNDCGCKKPIVIAALKDFAATKLRTNGFLKACKECRLEMDEEHLFYPETVSLSSGFEIMDQVIRSGLTFDSVFCETDWLAIGAYTALMKHEFSIPDAVQLIGFDDIRASRITQPPITTIHQPSKRIGAKAADMLLSMLEGENPNGRVEIMPVELIRRMTTRFQLER